MAATTYGSHTDHPNTVLYAVLSVTCLISIVSSLICDKIDEVYEKISNNSKRTSTKTNS